MRGLVAAESFFGVGVRGVPVERGPQAPDAMRTKMLGARAGIWVPAGTSGGGGLVRLDGGTAAGVVRCARRETGS